MNFIHPMLLTYFPLILLVLPLAYCYQTSNVLKHYVAQSGTTTLNSLPNSTTNFVITFKKPFSSLPKYVISLASIHYSVLDPIEYFDLTTEKSMGTTQVSINTYWLHNSSISLVTFFYFVYSSQKITYLKNHDFAIKIYNINNSVFNSQQRTQVLDTMYNMNSSDVKILCYIQKIRGVKKNGSQYQIILQCTKKNDTAISVYVKCIQDFNALTDTIDGTPYYVKDFSVSIIVVLSPQNSAIVVISGVLLAYNGGPSITISVNISSPSQILGIGLKTFSIPQRALIFALNNQSRSIQYGTFNSLKYDYFTIKKTDDIGMHTYLYKITSNFYQTQIQLHYRNLTGNLNNVDKKSFKLQSNENRVSVSDGRIGNVAGQYIVECNYEKQIENKDVIGTYNYSLVTEYYQRKTIFRVLVIKEIVMFYEQKVAKLLIINARLALKDNFAFSTSNIVFLNASLISDNTQQYIKYSDSAVGINIKLLYTNAYYGDNFQITFILPKLWRILTSTKTNKITIQISNFDKVYSDDTVIDTYKSSDFTDSFYPVRVNDSLIDLVLEYKKESFENLEAEFVGINFSWNYSLGCFIEFPIIKVITLVNLIHKTDEANVYQLVFINLEDVENGINVSQFSTGKDGIILRQVNVKNNRVVLVIQTQPNTPDYDENQFDITFQSSNTYEVIIKSIKIRQKFINFTAIKDRNNIDIYFYNKNTNLINASNLPEISFGHSYISLVQISVTEDNKILIKAKYNKTVDGDTLQIFYSQNITIGFYQTITLKLDYQFRLQFCIKASAVILQLYYIFSQILLYLYLGVFAISFVMINKIMGIEMMFLIQFAYYSMMSIELNCGNRGVSKMQYASGYNPLFKGMNESWKQVRYTDLGIQSNFVSNVNIMVFIIIICPILYGILMYLGNKSGCYKKKPRFLKYGKAFMYQVPFTILLFNSFNIYTSLVIQIQYFNSKTIISLVTGVVISLLLPSYGLIYYFFKHNFSEFRQQFEINQKIGHWAKETSTKIRQLYPLILMTEFILTPLLISIQALFSFSFYIVLTFTIITSVFTMLSTPYLYRIDNIRLFIHRIILTSIIICQINFKIAATSEQSSDSFLPYFPLVLLTLLTIGFIVDGGNIIRLSYLWIRKRGIIDHNLKIKQQSTKVRPVTPYSKSMKDIVDDDKWYPRLQYGEFKREKIIKIRNDGRASFQVQENMLDGQHDQYL